MSLDTSSSSGWASHIQSVVLVGRFRQRGYADEVPPTDLSDKTTTGSPNCEVAHASMIFLKIFQANLQVQFTRTCDNVLTSFIDRMSQTQGSDFERSLETFDKLGQVIGILDFNRTLHDWVKQRTS